jgi:hypothetical protein
MSPVVTLPVGLLVSTLLPLFALPQGQTRTRRWLTIAAAAVTIIGAAVTPFLPTYSESVPQPVNVHHYEDRDVGMAYWVAAPFRGKTPDPLRQKFDAEPRVVFPWSSREHPVAKAPATTAPAPDLQLLSDEQIGGERVVKVQLRSPRGANEIDLFVPIENLKSVTAAGDAFAVSPEDSWNGYYTFWCYGRSCDGLEITLRFKNTEPVEVLLVDHSPGLPPAGEPLIQARPVTAVPSQGGDSTMILHRVKF